MSANGDASYGDLVTLVEGVWPFAMFPTAHLYESPMALRNICNQISCLTEQ